MQNAAISSTAASAGLESNLQSQIAAMRESLGNQRARARKLWDDCAPDAGKNAEETRVALGRFTDKLLKGQLDAVY